MHAKHFFFPTNVAISMPGLENTSWTITFAKTSRIGKIPQKKKNYSHSQYCRIPKLRKLPLPNIFLGREEQKTHWMPTEMLFL